MEGSLRRKRARLFVLREYKIQSIWIKQIELAASSAPASWQLFPVCQCEGGGSNKGIYSQ